MRWAEREIARASKGVRGQAGIETKRGCPGHCADPVAKGVRRAPIAEGDG